jgi:uncharacterized Zn finger protein (UPF0148 family)
MPAESESNQLTCVGCGGPLPSYVDGKTSCSHCGNNYQTPESRNESGQEETQVEDVKSPDKVREDLIELMIKVNSILNRGELEAILEMSEGSLKELVSEPDSIRNSINKILNIVLEDKAEFGEFMASLKFFEGRSYAFIALEKFILENSLLDKPN